MPVAVARSTRRNLVPDYAILAAVLVVLAVSCAMMFGIIPLPF